ncbi:hypothetical protein QF000_005506 [Paraburkholderia atlantica]|uniref:hypothetical protein n=1 Tax=Paraburkholderia atlantica TaxID=2654982 RepID=UPI003D24334D
MTTLSYEELDKVAGDLLEQLPAFARNSVTLSTRTIAGDDYIVASLPESCSSIRKDLPSVVDGVLIKYQFEGRLQMLSRPPACF